MSNLVYDRDSATGQTVPLTDPVFIGNKPGMIPMLGKDGTLAINPGIYGVPGLVNDGSVDCTSAIQAALTAVGNAGGGIVKLGIGNYLSGPLTIPPFVTLAGVAGCWQTHPRPTSGNWTPARLFDFTHGTTLSTTAGAVSFTGSPTENAGTPFITIKDSACLRDLAIYHPNQDPLGTIPTSYPWAISTSGMHACIENVELVNPFQGILASNYSHRHIIRNVSGQPLYIGLKTDTCVDVAHHENIHFVPNWSYKTGDTEGSGGTFNGPYNWTKLNGTSFYYRRSDDQRASDIFSLGYRTGAYFDSSGPGTYTGACYGIFKGLGFDFCTNPLVFADTNPAGVKITGLDCYTEPEVGTGDNVTAIKLPSSHNGCVIIENFSIRGQPQYYATVEGNGVFILRGGVIDGYDRRNANTPGCYLVSGMVNVSDIVFQSRGANALEIQTGARGVVHDLVSRAAPVTVVNNSTTVIVHNNL